MYAKAYNIFFSKRWFLMKFTRDMLMMTMGAGAVLAYQKYRKPVMKKMECVANKAYKKADKALEDMM